MSESTRSRHAAKNSARRRRENVKPVSRAKFRAALREAFGKKGGAELIRRFPHAGPPARVMNDTATTERVSPLSIASRELLMARSCIDVLHDIFSLGDGVLKETVCESIPGMLYDVLERVRRAEEAVNSLPHC